MAASWQTGPPKHVSHARLWRLLSTCERPELAIPYRIPCAPGLALSVQGLTGHELAEALDRDDTNQHGDPIGALISAALLADGQRAFRICDVGALYPSEFHSLSLEVLRALETISPFMALSDRDEWNEALGDGAASPCNISIASTMADCYSMSIGGQAIWRMPRPDRYYGKHTGALTDGQLMAFRAAFDVVWKRRGDSNG